MLPLPSTVARPSSESRVWDSLSTPLIKFHEFPVPVFNSPPAKTHSAFQFPSHLIPSFYSALHLRKQVAELLSALSTTTKRVIAIYDPLIPYVGQDVASLSNGEAYSFHPLSGFRIFCETVGESGFEIIDDQVVKQLPSIASTRSSEVMEFFYKQREDLVKYSSGALFNTPQMLGFILRTPQMLGLAGQTSS